MHLHIKTQERQSQQIKNGEHAGECQLNVKYYQGHVQKHSKDATSVGSNDRGLR